MADTIAAIATATGGGVGIVRLSGPRAESIVRALCPGVGELPSHRLTLARVVDDGEELDEVLAVVMRAPRSYTGEDVVELHAHGGAQNLERLLHAVIDAGARLATPGEFTRRAFLAGRMDLTQAEAIAAVIGARDQHELRAAHALRTGALGREVARARGSIVRTLAELEGAIDFPDEVGETDEGARASELRQCKAVLQRLAASRRVTAEVPEVAIVGAANAGKSSLLNALVGEERALVDAEPGTTRDVVEAELVIDARRVRLLDTAGRRSSPTPLEARGLELADARRQNAALVLHVYDRALGWTSDDEALAASIAQPSIVVGNKADRARDSHGPGLKVSALEGVGIDSVRHSIARLLEPCADELPTSARQAGALSEAARRIERALGALEGTAGPRAPEVAAVELRAALTALGQLTGERVETAVLDELFSRFCIGK